MCGQKSYNTKNFKYHFPFLHLVYFFFLPSLWLHRKCKKDVQFKGIQRPYFQCSLHLINEARKSNYLNILARALIDVSYFLNVIFSYANLRNIFCHQNQKKNALSVSFSSLTNMFYSIFKYQDDVSIRGCASFQSIIYLPNTISLKELLSSFSSLLDNEMSFGC